MLTSVRARWVDVLAGAHRRVPWGVALTFDDATPALLDHLRDLEVRATFFLLADAVHRDPELARRMRREGHGVGSRSKSLAPHDIEAAVVAVQLVLGKRSNLFRPALDQLDVRAAVAMRRARLDSWLWTVDGRTEPHEHDVVRLDPDRDQVRRTVELVRADGLDFVAL